VADAAERDQVDADVEPATAAAADREDVRRIHRNAALAPFAEAGQAEGVPELLVLDQHHAASVGRITNWIKSSWTASGSRMPQGIKLSRYCSKPGPADPDPLCG
jgi:hypothetical protein